ncbi:usick-Kaufman Bardet-Biedl syndromes chaperonin-like [Octopus vulgaris]|uniref:Usick-Kaufman Bardet-Biedl syndromes chaperonin-like n=1 Tax=Octopus vulgaris TaxID=6645 RepID=A0AA36AV66_OCTVU|nr:usick-Kaufman Bardet-Biedl syndromes chaperonin-like [Octopus vulgaris]
MQEVTETKLLRGKLTDKETVHQLNSLRHLFSTTVGPYGGIKLLRNNCGGHVTLTSSSSRLLAALRPTNPLARLIIEACSKHSHTYGDGALFMAHFILILIDKALKLDLDHRLITKVNSFLLELFLSYLKSDDFSCKMAVEISDVNSLCQVASTMLSSKPLYQLDEQLLKLMSSVLLEAFIRSLPSERQDSSLRPILDNIHIIGIPGEETHNSFCCEGLLLEATNIKEVLSWQTQRESLENICTVVVNVSMAGDSIELPQLTYASTSLKELEQSFLSHMESFCSELISKGIRILFCQKVVHPCLKDQLRRNGVLVLDRLGALLCSKVINLTGSVPISSFSSACSPDQLGKISKFSVMDVFGKQWLHLNQISSSLTTLVVCSQMEEQLEELKVNCNNVMLAFQHLLRTPAVLHGGGCWQFTLANKLRVEVSENLESFSSKLDCSESQLLQLCDYLCTSLEQAVSPSSQQSKKCFTHPSAGHLWIQDDHEVNAEKTCSCGVLCCSLSDLKLQPLEHSPSFDRFSKKELYGSYKPLDTISSSEPPKKPLLMDCFIPWQTAVEISVLLANMALSTNQFIFDTNCKPST